MAGRTVPERREQIVAEQAHLEHERSRLRRELDMWRENVRKTAERLQAVEARMARLGREPDRRPARNAEGQGEAEPLTI